MSYNVNIPSAGDFLSLSQKQMLANFQAINNSFFQNHVGLTSIDDIGKHNTLVLRPQSADPTTTADQSAIYNKLVGSEPQLFFRPSSNATPIQLSNSNLNTAQTGAPLGTQSSFLAGPFTIYMGYIINCPNLQLVTLTPSSTLIYAGLSTYLNGQRNPAIQNIALATSITGSQFTVRYPTNLTAVPTIYYMAIGI